MECFLHEAANTRSLFHCRDTAGQERFEAITKQYYRRAQVITNFVSIKYLLAYVSIGSLKQRHQCLVNTYLVLLRNVVRSIGKVHLVF